MQEKDHLNEKDKLKEEIEMQEKHMVNLKCDMEKLQQTVDQLLAELDGKKKDFADAKMEHQQQLELVKFFLFFIVEKKTFIFMVENFYLIFMVEKTFIQAVTIL